MKTLFCFLTALLLCGPPSQAADVRVSVSLDLFYDNLQPYGDWREIGDYGYCWQPRDVDEGWTPYSEGRWLYTDAGWTFDTDEPYGWAVYHYGRWADIEDIGWVWVPDTEWGPGWVSWRHSEGYVGWAPLPPEAQFRYSVGISSWADDYYDIGPGSYHFVESRNLGARRLRSVFIDQRQNFTIINQTTNVTNISYINNVVHNGGPRYEHQSSLSSEPIRRYTLDRRRDFYGDHRREAGQQFRSRIEGDSLSIMAPPIDRGRDVAPQKLRSRVDRVQRDRGWKQGGSPGNIAETRAKMNGHTPPPAELPERPKYQHPGHDKPPGPKTDEPRQKPQDLGPGDKPPGRRGDDPRVKPKGPGPSDRPPGPKGEDPRVNPKGPGPSDKPPGPKGEEPRVDPKGPRPGDKLSGPRGEDPRGEDPRVKPNGPGPGDKPSGPRKEDPRVKPNGPVPRAVSPTFRKEAPRAKPKGQDRPPTQAQRPKGPPAAKLLPRPQAPKAKPAPETVRKAQPRPTAPPKTERPKAARPPVNKPAAKPTAKPRAPRPARVSPPSPKPTGKPRAKEDEKGGKKRP